MSLLFEVISTAYERPSLIVTTNLPFENWTEVLGSERLTGATLDRLTHRCHILEATGDYYRTFKVSEAIDPSKIAADYSDGVLTLHLPKNEAVKARRIEVQTG